MEHPGIIVEQETEARNGWSLLIRIERRGEHDRRIVHLSWVDHEYWSRGGSGPAKVVGALIAFLIERGGLERLGASFDAAAARRIHPEIDRELPRRL